MQLVELPNEILSRIISFLDTCSPFDGSTLQKPKFSLPFYDHDLDPDPEPESRAAVFSSAVLTTTGNQDQHHPHHPLKQLSLTSRLMRSLSLQTLFKHAVLHPLQLTDFLSFLQRHDLSQRVASLVVHVPGHFNHLHPTWWARLLNEVPATRFSIVAAPEIFAALAGVCSWNTDAWAFDMSVQIMRFDQSPEAARSRIDYDELPNVLVARPWHSMLINEGSSLMAYTTYEFFLRRTPSLLSALHFDNSAAGDALFANLTSFDFIAIFPFYNHVDEVLKCIRKMKKLQSLFVKLCPEPDSSVFHDEVEVAGGHLDVHDPWNECETSWMLIAHTVVFLTIEGKLQELRMDDVRVDGVRQTLENSLTARLQECWLYEDPGSGIWRRKPTGKGSKQ